MDISLSGGRLWAYNSRGTSKVTMVIAHAPWYNYELTNGLTLIILLLRNMTLL